MGNGFWGRQWQNARVVFFQAVYVYQINCKTALEAKAKNRKCCHTLHEWPRANHLISLFASSPQWKYWHIPFLTRTGVGQYLWAAHLSKGCSGMQEVCAPFPIPSLASLGCLFISLQSSFLGKGCDLFSPFLFLLTQTGIIVTTIHRAVLY